MGDGAAVVRDLGESSESKPRNENRTLCGTPSRARVRLRRRSADQPSGKGGQAIKLARSEGCQTPSDARRLHHGVTSRRYRSNITSVLRTAPRSGSFPACAVIASMNASA